jgi:hypothetical protein
MSEAAARKLDDAGRFYTAVRNEDDHVTLLEINMKLGHIGVRFLDDKGRRSLDYLFQKTEDGRMFLADMMVFDYANSEVRGDRADPSVIESYRFAPDGTVRRETDNKKTREVETVDTHSVDVSDHWEPVPAFGAYDSIARHNRTQLNTE